jgi:hypothetical protein
MTTEREAAAASDVLVRLKRPEGYEDVHPQLVLEDAHIHPAFEAEVVAPQAAAASEPDVLKLAQECGATVYRNRASPHQPAVAFGDEAWTKFCAALSSSGSASQDSHEKGA